MASLAYRGSQRRGFGAGWPASSWWLFRCLWSTLLVCGIWGKRDLGLCGVVELHLANAMHFVAETERFLSIFVTNGTEASIFALASGGANVDLRWCYADVWLVFPFALLVFFKLFADQRLLFEKFGKFAVFSRPHGFGERHADRKVLVVAFGYPVAEDPWCALYGGIVGRDNAFSGG